MTKFFVQLGRESQRAVLVMRSTYFDLHSSRRATPLLPVSGWSYGGEAPQAALPAEIPVFIGGTGNTRRNNKKKGGSLLLERGMLLALACPVRSRYWVESRTS